MKYLVTATMEFYKWVEADSEEEVQEILDSTKEGWYQTINEPLRNIKIQTPEIDTTGQESS